ncbi:hypothetical protein [Thermococcus sp. AM4]|uniref:hypothetical protein n=1 Tax=Thermococcus sp. (strain AM4) TaxID=246969 RepID=UPI0001870B6B|nr:hypothetical protein [Thermococcus sp. AM4]EEB73442.1 conserved hypothetical protein [Thermococcus sp. AM4]
MAEVINYGAIIKRIEKIERDLEELKLELLRKEVESKAAEEIDEEAYEEILRKAEEIEKDGISGRDAIKLLESSLEE